jgi:hypothetical protein
MSQHNTVHTSLTQFNHHQYVEPKDEDGVTSLKDRVNSLEEIVQHQGTTITDLYAMTDNLKKRMGDL